MSSRNRKAKTVLPHRKIIGDAIRTRRRRSRLTQEQLAERVNLNPKYLGEVERGEKIISIEALMRIAEAVKTPAHVFLRDI